MGTCLCPPQGPSLGLPALASPPREPPQPPAPTASVVPGPGTPAGPRRPLSQEPVGVWLRPPPRPCTLGRVPNSHSLRRHPSHSRLPPPPPRRKVEDLQFRVDEESITKDDLEVKSSSPEACGVQARIQAPPGPCSSLLGDGES